jgi:hypothetical protein
MMTDNIGPVLTAEEWAEVRAPNAGMQDGNLAQSFERGSSYIDTHFWDDEQRKSAPILIALANAALPDTDPRKITREWVKALRAAAFALREQPLGVSDDWRHMDATWANLGGAQRARHEASALALSALAAALESYLPPE